MTQLEFFTALANGAKWGVPATISRSGSANGGLPIDAYSIFDSKAKAELYASQNKAAVEAAGMVNNAYVGQIITVWEKVPVIGEDGQPAVDDNGQAVTADDVSVYYIDADKTLKPVGIVPTGDGATIEVTAEGAISLAGFTGANTGYLPRKAEDGTLEWVPISAVVQSDGNSVTTVEAKDASVVVSDVAEEGFEGHKYEVKVNVSEAEGNKVELKDDGLFVAETDLSDYYNKEHVDAIENRVKAVEDDHLVTADKTALEGSISGVADRVTTLEGVVGNADGGLVKAIADEISAREQGDADTLDAAKTYADERVDGISVAIEAKEGVEHIVIKNVEGTEIASVDATKFVKDGMLDAAEYSTETKKLTLTWNTDAGKSSTIIDLNDLVNTYTGSDHVTVGTDGVISIKETVALKTDVSDLDTKLSAEIAKKRTEAEVDAQIDAKITAANLGQYAKAADVETGLGKKLDKATYEADQAQYATDKATFAIKSDVETELGKKVDKTTYESDKATFAVAETVNGQFTSVGERIDGVEEDVAANTKAIEDLETAVAETYATKEELAPVTTTANNAAAKVTNLEEKIKEITEVGGEPNSIEYIKVNGEIQTPDSDKAVDIAIPTAVSDLTDGASLIAAVNANTTATGAHATAITAIEQRLDAENTGLAVLNTRLAALETEVKIEGESRIDALEGILNGSDEVAGLVSTVAGHTTAISGLQSKDNELAGLIAGNTAKFDDYYTKTVIDGKVTAIEQAIANVDLSSRVAVTDFNAYKEATAATIATLAVAETVNAALELKADKTTVDTVATDLAGEIARATAAEQKIADDLALLIENPTEALDSVKELITHVQANGTAVEGIITRLDGHDTAIANNKAAHEKNASDIVAINDAIAAIVQPKASTEVTVAEDGTLGLGEVSTDKLVQGVDTLVLNGGNASVKSAE